MPYSTKKGLRKQLLNKPTATKSSTRQSQKVFRNGFLRRQGLSNNTIALTKLIKNLKTYYKRTAAVEKCESNKALQEPRLGGPKISIAVRQCLFFNGAHQSYPVELRITLLNPWNCLDIVKESTKVWTANNLNAPNHKIAEIATDEGLKMPIVCQVWVFIRTF